MYMKTVDSQIQKEIVASFILAILLKTQNKKQPQLPGVLNKLAEYEYLTEKQRFLHTQI